MVFDMFQWRTKMWMETSHWSFKQLIALLVVNLVILTVTFPFGPLFCVVMFVKSLISYSNITLKPGDGQKKKVCIIGGGVSGITSAVCMLEEGHDVEIFEKDDAFGGVWQFAAQKRDGDEKFSGQVWQNLITTSSAYITSFSAFPPSKECEESKEHPYHMTADMYYSYLKAYMKNGGVKESHFRLNSMVKKMQRKGEKWELVVEPKEGKQYTTECDFVVVSTGQHQTKKGQTFPGLEDFKGDILHSSDYVNPSPYVNKRVLVIGGGDSGADIVKHIGDICKPGECYMSLRRGAHVAPRYFYTDKLPIDYAMFRFAYYLPHLLRTNILRRAFYKIMEKVALTDKTSKLLLMLHKINGMSASTYFTTKSEEMCKAFSSGTATLKPEVERFTEGGVEFKVPPNDNPFNIDTTPVEIDSVILCTGFTTVFPFLPDDVQDHEHLDRYRLVFHPDMKNVAFIGFVRPTGFGAIPPCAEMQARWAAQVCSGKVDLPSPDYMKTHAADVKKRYVAVRKLPNQMLVFFTYYLAEVAHEFGANPVGLKLFMKSPALWKKVMFGPYTSHQYRLFGPHAKFDEAKRMIMQKITNPNPGHGPENNCTFGPLARPPKLVLLAAASFFGVVSQIPILGRPFAPCI